VIELLWGSNTHDGTSLEDITMPAKLIPNEAIPQVAARIDPPMLLVLRALRQRGFIQNGQDVTPEVLALLQRLAALELADPAYSTPEDRKPFIWVENNNGDRVLKYIETLPPHERADREPRVRVHPRAQTALAALSEAEHLAVVVAAASLHTGDPTSWPREKAVRLGEDKEVYLLRVTPALRAFIRILDPKTIELFDIVREETLQLFLERQQAGSAP
jgi:hypothetical protein